jgi:histidyl-tRNA synthetase
VTTNPTTPAGVLELLPSEQVTHDAMLDTIRRGYRRFGFVPIETPVFERTEVLLTKTGGETEKQVYYVQSAGALEQESDPDLAMRFDLTVPLARYVAEHEHDLVFPFRRSQIQRVYRGERPQRGRYREFYQCDIDVIDRNDLSLRHDAEVPAAMVAILRELAIGDTTVRVNNRRLMRTLLEECDITDPPAQEGVLREVDKLDRLGDDAVATNLVEGGMSQAAVDRLLSWTSIEASGRSEIEAALEDLPTATKEPGAGGLELAEVIRTMGDLEVPEDAYELDLSIARGLDYYTGTVYETTLDAHPELGSICSGGRYDDLAGQYTNTRLPGVGMSIGFTRLFWQLREAGILPGTEPAVTVMVTLIDDSDLPYTLKAASLLRAAGIATETSMEAGRLGKQLKNADRAGIPIALIAGSEERETESVAVRDLVTGDQERVGLGDLVDHIHKLQNG